MKYFSLFSGIGGFELGIQQAYENQENQNESLSQEQTSVGDSLRPKGDSSNSTISNSEQHKEYRPECIGFSEIDKYAIQIYQQHFNHTNYGDITKIDERGLPDFELLCGGFPCQSFSIAGKRGGFEDTRGTLFFDIARIAKYKRPRLLFLENVKGLLSHDNGRTFNTIVAVLDELGYDLQWQVLNSKNFGVPQNRERVFIVGHLRGFSRPQVFPIRQTSQVYSISSGERCSNTLTSRSASGRNGRGNYIQQLNQPAHSNNRIYGTDGISPTLNTAQGGNRQPKIIQLTESRTEESKQIRKENIKKGKDWSPRRGKELVPRKDDQANTLTGNQTKEQLLIIRELSPYQGDHITQPDEVHPTIPANGGNKMRGIGIQDTQMKIRRLTPTECERLQGFPDGWTAGVSDTQRYKCLGNAVTVNVIQAIAEKLLR